MALPAPTTGCQVDDVGVAQGPNGYVVSHACSVPGLGVRWESMFTFSTFEEACQVARELATKSTGRAWRRVDGAHYVPLEIAAAQRSTEPSAPEPAGPAQTVQA